MFFNPGIGVGGLAGWRVLEATETRQREVFERSPVIDRDVDYFLENISSISSAEDLVDDRRLLTVALGAFNLSDEINKKAFIQKIIKEGTESSDAFANRMNDPRFRDLANAFDFGNVTQGSNVLLQSFRDDIVAKFKSLEFERAVGETDNDMRLALNFRREISEIADGASSERTAWFVIMGQRPLREVIATALNISSSIDQLDIDRQQEIFARQAERVFGSSSPEVFNDPEVVDAALRRFFLFRQLESGPNTSTPGFAALTLLQSSGLGGNGLSNLLLSQS